MTDSKPVSRQWNWRPALIGVIIGAAIIVIIVVAFLGYFLRWSWIGFTEYTKPSDLTVPAKTLWDWLQLLIVPFLLVTIGWAIQRAERQRTERQAQTEREIAEDRQREAALQTYLDRMTELLLSRTLSRQNVDDPVKIVARARTLTTLSTLDGKRKGLVVRFLYELGLLTGSEPILSMSGADLSRADLAGAVMPGINLHDANLRQSLLLGCKLPEADLSGASLIGANLGFANLSKANLRKTGMYDFAAELVQRLASAEQMVMEKLGGEGTGIRSTEPILPDADLMFANFKEADLREMRVRDSQLEDATLDGAIMPDGTKHA